MRARREPAGSQGGMALIAVLWIVAALSIIVTGMVSSVRNEVRVNATTRQTVLAGALGNAAIHLALQSIVARPERPSRLSTFDTLYQNQTIRVQVLPLNGLIDINRAPPGLLASLYVVAGKLDPQAAAALAQATLDTREPKEAGARLRGFEASEDLLRVPGMSYTLYANISRLITADVQGSGRVNPMAAPEGVLAVLADGNVERAAKIAADRDAGLAGVDTTTLNGAYIEPTASTQRFRLQARVPLPDGAWLLSSRSVDFGGGAQDGLPWRTFHTETRFEAAPGKIN